MAIVMTANVAAEGPLNTVAVVPFDLAPTTSSRSTSSSSSTTASSLAASASNLISAIAQGSSLNDTHDEAHSDADSDEGSSSFTYTAPVSTAAEASATGWYVSTPYHISNRYYDADITLKATKAALPSVSSPVDVSADSVLSQPFPAYVVVVDRSRSLEHHRLIASNLETKVASGFDADISIVAGVSLLSSSHPRLVTNLDDEPVSAARGQSEASAKTSDLVALYADHGWEFIAIDDADDGASADARSLGSVEGDYSDVEDEDDADGIERIREALMNHMWNGLVRKDQAAASAHRTSLRELEAIESVTSAHRGFSDSFDAPHAGDRSAPSDLGETSTSPSQRLDDAHELDAALPALQLDQHADASDLDEQLAKLFLASSSTGGNDLAELEAFLASEDPSWPAVPPSDSTLPSTNESGAFEDDFDDFLPFQSAAPTGSSGDKGRGADDDFPPLSEIEAMQSRLFGANAAARLEGGALGMGSGSAGGADQDLAAQLQQLQWHAQRVRQIEDADQRRKEAALVALAFSMQWSNDTDDDAGAMTL